MRISDWSSDVCSSDLAGSAISLSGANALSVPFPCSMETIMGVDQIMQDIIDGVPGRYWHRLDDVRIQCDVCPRECKLKQGQRGLCFVRGRPDDQVVSTTISAAHRVGQ